MAGYALDQCGLFNISTKAKLASRLQVHPKTLFELAEDGHYKEFSLRASVCEFTGKKTKARNVFEPKRALKQVHQRIGDLLSRVQLVDYAHAAVKGRSYRSNAEAHRTGVEVATFDIENFYPSTGHEHVFRFFHRELRCEADVAHLLGRLLCVRTKGNVHGCLPTGSPASPILSVYANKPLFDALHALAHELGLVFTCYVDDLTFSGPSIPPSLARRVGSIVARHGHRLHPTKTKIFRAGEPRHITGVVIVNGRLTVPAARFKKVRLVQQRLIAESDPGERGRLSRILSGLLGEASFLDPAFSQMAQAGYRASAVEARAPLMTVGGAVMRLPPRAPHSSAGVQPLAPSSLPWE